MTSVIDIHIHIQPLGKLKPAVLELTRHSRYNFAQIEKFSADPVAFLKYLDEVGVERTGLISSVSPEVIGYTSEVSDWTARYCSASPGRLIAFGSVYPRHVNDAGTEVDRLVKIGIRALKIHPPHQLFSPNAYRDGLGPLATIYERAQAMGPPIKIHTRTSIFPGARNLYAQPIFADDVAVDYPDLVIILAHGGRPLWMDEAFFLVRRHKNMYMDISGIPPQNCCWNISHGSRKSLTRCFSARTGRASECGTWGRTSRSSRHCPARKRPNTRFSTTTLRVYSRRSSNSCKKMTSEDGGSPQGFSSDPVCANIWLARTSTSPALRRAHSGWHPARTCGTSTSS